MRAKQNGLKPQKNVPLKRNAVVGCYTRPLKTLGFHLLYQLGHGSEGVVFLVVNERTGKKCAVKVCDRRKCPKNATGEFLLWAHVDHPNCLKIQDKIVYKKLVYYVMQYTPNMTVLDWIQDAWYTPGIVTDENAPGEEMLKKWCRQILAGLQYLHYKNYYHLDIKPDNLFLDENWNVKIGDFGFMRSGDDLSEPLLLGCPAYVPPEGLKYPLNQKIDLAKVDIWSTGVTILEMLTGKLLSGKNFRICVQRRISLLQNLRENQPKAVRMPTFYPGGRDLIIHLIRWEPDSRVTATEALQHPWLRLKCGDPQMNPDTITNSKSNILKSLVSAATSKFARLTVVGKLAASVATNFKILEPIPTKPYTTERPRNKLTGKRTFVHRAVKEQSSPAQSTVNKNLFRKRKMNDGEDNGGENKRFKPNNFKNESYR